MLTLAKELLNAPHVKKKICLSGHKSHPQAFFIHSYSYTYFVMSKKTSHFNLKAAFWRNVVAFINVQIVLLYKKCLAHYSVCIKNNILVHMSSHII